MDAAEMDLTFNRKWYLQPWVIAVLFALWPLFFIPLVAGIILLIASTKERKAEADAFDTVKGKYKNAQNLLKEAGMLDRHQKEERIRQIEAEVEKRELDLANIEHRVTAEQTKLDALMQNIVQTQEEILLQSFALYKPKYDFDNVEKYRAELEKIRTVQKDLIKSGRAASGNMNWQVNGNASKGKKMVQDMQKLLLRAFNSECDEVISRVKYNNFDASLKRITNSYEAVSKLGKLMDVAITKPYYNAKIDELHLALEYQMQKQKEKEEQKATREMMREEAKLQREIEEQRRKLDKEQSHYQSALAKLNAQLELASESDLPDLQAKKAEIESHLCEIAKSISDVDYRQANQRAGYVYIISNIGAFGDNVYKIGMTRRLDPTERVDELGDASVPFNFDIHAMIFCDDAPALETALHRAFENKKLNWINTRREFFCVTLEEIKDVVRKNYDKTAEFIDIAEAEQFRISRKMQADSVT